MAIELSSPVGFAVTARDLDDDARWDAVCRRDPTAATAFVYAVRTTGIYCRPTCGSRRPLRENVEFHRCAADARAAGFRPCLRCRPDAEHGAAAAALVTRICRLIDAADEPPTLAELARAAGMSASHFHRLFTATLGITPHAYGAARRAVRSRALLRSKASVTEALHEAGYGSHSAFYGDRALGLGMPASRFRRGAAGETIRFAIGACWLGFVLAAATARGVCAILLGNDRARLSEELRAIYPGAVLAGPDTAFDALLAQVVRLIDAPAHPGAVPLDIRGTAFQRRVWDALLAVPPGSTVTYTELARRIGAPTSARAVGSACAANTLAVAVPCHRAVRADGGLSGYRWGVERKRALLDREASGDKRRARKKSGRL